MLLLEVSQAKATMIFTVVRLYFHCSLKGLLCAVDIPLTAHIRHSQIVKEISFLHDQDPPPGGIQNLVRVESQLTIGVAQMIMRQSIIRFLAYHLSNAVQ